VFLRVLGFFILIGLLGHPFFEAWKSFLLKMEKMNTLYEGYNHLKAENSELRLLLEKIRFEFISQRAFSMTKKKEKKLLLETGSKVGRVLASLTDSVPQDLFPQHLFGLGVHFFSIHEYEKAALIFSDLLYLKQDFQKKPPYLFAAAVSWYQIENYFLADHYFDELLSQFTEKRWSSYQSQSLVWKALIAKKINQEKNSQILLKKLLDQFPSSLEVLWINPQKQLSRNLEEVSNEKVDEI